MKTNTVILRKEYSERKCVCIMHSFRPKDIVFEGHAVKGDLISLLRKIKDGSVSKKFFTKFKGKKYPVHAKICRLYSIFTGFSKSKRDQIQEFSATYVNSGMHKAIMPMKEAFNELENHGGNADLYKILAYIITFNPTLS